MRFSTLIILSTLFIDMIFTKMTHQIQMQMGLTLHRVKNISKNSGGSKKFSILNPLPYFTFVLLIGDDHFQFLGGYIIGYNL